MRLLPVALLDTARSPGIVVVAAGNARREATCFTGVALLGPAAGDTERGRECRW
jgi:hypothetical protein